VAVRRLDCLAVNRGTTGLIEAMPLWAGESVSAVKRVQPAAEIVRELVEEAESLLQSWGAALQCCLDAQSPAPTAEHPAKQA
jgi:hypothetical protein